MEEEIKKWLKKKLEEGSKKEEDKILVKIENEKVKPREIEAKEIKNTAANMHIIKEIFIINRDFLKKFTTLEKSAI